MDIFYASHFGHTEEIARRLAAGLAACGVPARLRNLSADWPVDSEISSAEPCVLISPIRYGVHLRQARRLLARLAPLTPNKPLVLISVNLTARKPGKTSATGNAYLRKWIRRTGAHPRLAEALAGKLEYPRYNLFDKSMIRFIMLITGGPTDGQAVVDYTPWARVDALAGEIGALVQEAGTKT